MIQFTPLTEAYVDPNTREALPLFVPRQVTLDLLNAYEFEDDAGKIIEWTPAQIEIIDCILHRSAPDARKRIQIIAATQYGKSLAVAAGCVIRASTKPEKWAIVAGTTEKAQIIMEYVIMLSLNNGTVRQQLTPETPLDRLRMKKSTNRLVFKCKGEIRVYSAEAKIVSETSKSLMGFGCIQAGCKVLTDKGEVEISKLVKEKTTDKVWSFNHLTRQMELKKILCYQENSLGKRKLLNVETDKGNFVCTNDHPVWIGDKYIPAERLQVGNVGLGLINDIGFGILNQCKLFVKSAIKNFINVLVMRLELSTTSVAGNVGELAIGVKETQDGLNQKPASIAVKNIKEKVKSFVLKNVWDYSKEAKDTVGTLVKGIIIIIGRLTRLSIKLFMLGLTEISKNQISVNTVDEMKIGQDLYTGLTKAGNTKETEVTGLDSVPLVTKNMIKKVVEIKSISDSVYNLEVEDNHNYFIERCLLHNSPNVIEDESALIGDVLQATVMRMLGGSKDNFLIKIGNPFNRGHFLKTWKGGNYYRIFIDYQRALAEGRYTQEFIEEMRQEALFDILYACLFPGEESMTMRGWLPLLTEVEIERAMVDEEKPFGDPKLGNDVAGGGRNYSVIVHRAYNMMEKIYKDREPDTMVFVGTILNYKKELGVRAEDIFIDKVGVGKGAYDRASEINNRIVGVSAGSEPMEKTRYVNLRAEMYWRLREWILRGGKLKRDDDWYQLTQVKYKIADSSGKIKIMSKEEMLREGIDSPDVADAASLTFATQDIPPSVRNQQAAPEQDVNPDPYA